MTMAGKVTIDVSTEVRDRLRQAADKWGDKMRQDGVPNYRPGPHRVTMSEVIEVLLAMYVDEHGEVKHL